LPGQIKKEKLMELVFEKSTIGVAESAMTPEGIKITFVHRTKSLVIVYYGHQVIAECKNRQAALAAVSEYIKGGH
jgi:hypothetical protein